MTSINTPESTLKSTPPTPDSSTSIPTSVRATTTRKERWLTVGKFPEVRSKVGVDPDHHAYKPWIRLHGLWLREAGFTPQTRVRVRVMPGCLVITTE